MHCGVIQSRATCAAKPHVEFNGVRITRRSTATFRHTARRTRVQRQVNATPKGTRKHLADAGRAAGRHTGEAWSALPSLIWSLALHRVDAITDLLLCSDERLPRLSHRLRWRSASSPDGHFAACSINLRRATFPHVHPRCRSEQLLNAHFDS
mgnify:CR=1 FL=1